MMEKMPVHAPQPERAPEEEDAIAHFRGSCETEMGHSFSPEERVQTYHSFHEDLDHLENAPMIRQYEEGMIPTIASLTETARIASEALEADVSDEEAVRIGKLIRGQARGIRTWCRRYVGTIIQFHTVKKHMVRMNDAEQREKFAHIDSERRRVHESLLESLRTFTTLLGQGAEYAEYQKPEVWQVGTTLAAGTALHNPVIFSSQALHDRDLIKSWAIAADCVEEMKKILGPDDFPPKT